MATLLFLAFLVLFYKAIKRGATAARSKAKTSRTVGTVTAASRNLATLEALQAQRDELAEQLEIINVALDAAPPEVKRLRWMKERARVYGNLATVESKIARLIG